MIEPTDEMYAAFEHVSCIPDGVTAVLAIVERDYDVRERSAIPAVCGSVHPHGAYDCERPPGHSAQHLSWRAGPVIVW